MFVNEEGDSFDLPKNKPYYGEVKYQMEYKGKKSKPFDWLFVDAQSLTKIANTIGLNVEIIYKDEEHQFLAKLTKSFSA